MFFSPSHRFKSIVFLVLASLLHTACQSGSPAGVERIAILNFDNLSGDSQWNWLSAAAPPLWRAQLSGSSTTVAQIVRSPGEAAQMRATRLVTGYFFLRAGMLRGTVTIVDPQSGTTKATIVAEAKDPVLLLNDVSSRFALPIRPLATRDPKSMEAFGQALIQPDSLVRLKDAVTVDPSFGLAWIRLIDTLRAQGDVDGSIEAGKQASAMKSIPDVERAEIGLRTLPVSAPAAERLARLGNVSRANPGDAQAAINTAEFAVSARLLPKAVEWYRVATNLAPTSAQLWNSRGYAEAFSGDFENSKKSMLRYQALAPDDANANDSFGEVLYMQGNFTEAATVFQTGFQRQPNAFGANMLRKAAWARLRSGDVSGADKVFAQYIEFRQKLNDPFTPLRQAQWTYLTGRHDPAKKQLQQFGIEKKNPIAWAQLSIWERYEGNQSRAFEYAQKGIQGLAGAPQYANIVAIAAALAQPNAASDVWLQRMKGQPFAAIGILLSGEPEKAAQLLEAVRSKMHPLQEYYWKDLHAIALYRAGKKPQAGALLSSYALPETEEDSIILCFAFPEDQAIRKQLSK